MLRGINNQKLLESGLKTNYVSFYQIWKELTESKTFDAYQYKTTNILNGIRELVHNIIFYLDGTIYTTHSLDAVREELFSLLKKDLIMEENFPPLKHRLIHTLSKKYDSAHLLKGLKYQLECYYSELEKDYDIALTQKLATEVENSSPNQYMLTSQFISRCVDLGWSAIALSKKLMFLKANLSTTALRNFYLK